MSKQVIKGIYYYKDTLTDKIDYIGKDSNIARRTRYHAHKSKAYYDDQPFNRILQRNPERYEYGEFCRGPFSDDELIMLENLYKKGYSPRFDFEYRSHGGLTEIHKQRISQSKMGYVHKESSKQLMSEHHYDCSNENNPRFLKHLPSNMELYKEWRQGTSQNDLALKYNCGSATIQRRIRKYQNEIKGKPQLRTHGKRKDGRVIYCIYWNGDYLKYSIDKLKLINWFESKYGIEVISF